MTTDPDNTISFQGVRGAYSHMACSVVHPDMDVMACPSFDDAMEAVEEGRARLAMIPIENSTAGRVSDIHMMLPHSNLFIVAEHFQPINHCLLALKGARADQLKKVMSHVQGLHQCRGIIRHLGLEPVTHIDTAGAAQDVAELGDPSVAAIASAAAAEEYGLDIIRPDVHDRSGNVTRFVVLARRPNDPETLNGAVMTTFTFQVRNKPAALFKALSGFATEGVNITKLESYQDGDSFTASLFYADIEGYEGHANVARAMEELRFHSTRVRLFGSYLQARPRV